LIDGAHAVCFCALVAILDTGKSIVFQQKSPLKLFLRKSFVFLPSSSSLNTSPPSRFFSRSTLYLGMGKVIREYVGGENEFKRLKPKPKIFWKPLFTIDTKFD
jgi:hypothetical protein